MSDTTQINELASRAIDGFGHGHNSGAAPLSEILAEEIADDKKRADALIAAAMGCSIASDLDAANVATLVSLIRTHEKALDQAREQRKRPFLDDCRTVDAVFGAAMRPLVQARAGADGKSGLGGMLTAWERKREAAAAQERMRLLAEQRAREEEAERAREEAEAAKAKGNGSVAAELDALRKAEEAEALRRHAETLRPEPIRTLTGAVTTRREIAFRVVDEKKAIAWLYKNRRGELLQAARTILGSHLRSVGVDAAESAAIPGVEVTIEQRAQVR